MIIVKIYGTLSQQLIQYAFGQECAKRLNTNLKIDARSNLDSFEGEYFLDKYVINTEIANDIEINQAILTQSIIETTLHFDVATFEKICDGAYLDGMWSDYRYSYAGIGALSGELELQNELPENLKSIINSIKSDISVSIDLRDFDKEGLVFKKNFFEDAIREIRCFLPDAHFLILTRDQQTVFKDCENFTLVNTADRLSDEQCLELLRCCHHHIISDLGLSYFASLLDINSAGIVVTPQQIFSLQDIKMQALFGAIEQPVWPKNWYVLPSRVHKLLPLPHTFKGGKGGSRSIKIGVWNFYEEITKDGFLFKNTEASIGANLLKPWCDLYEYGQVNDIHFVTLDQIANISELDAVIFMDRPRPGHPLIEALLQSNICKYLILYECEVIKPDNWDLDFHKYFDRIFTWSDVHVDGHRYIKTNFAIDPDSPYDFDVLKSAFSQRKLATIIAGAKLSHHPNELYSERIRTIRWFEATAPHDFDLYGMGWSKEMFPSYKGPVNDKLATLSCYRFAICFENAKNIPGYITEKILDCFRAGTVPVYGGAPNISRWVPRDCYINMGDFATFFEMHAFLESMSSETHASYLERIRHYLNSEQSYPFTTECFINTVTEVVAWDVQLSRNERPLLLDSALTSYNISKKLGLVQNLQTMKIELEDLSSYDELNASENLKIVSSEDSLRNSLQNAGRKDLIVYFTYGDEMPVFTRARSLWEFYISYFPNVKVYFVRETNKLNLGEIQSNGYDLLVGIGDFNSQDPSVRNGYADTGIWSENENQRVIYRQLAIYDYLLRTNREPFYVYQATITSVVDFRGLLALLETMPAKACYAGMPGRLTSPPAYNGLTFVCGTNSLFSSDLLLLMRTRYDPDHEYATLPNDVWQALILQDIPRLSMPFFSFIKPRKHNGYDNKIKEMVKFLLDQGHYHFRVKTTTVQDGFGLREDVDPWIMLKIMEAILLTRVVPKSNIDLVEKLILCLNLKNGPVMSAFNEDAFFTGPRSFPLNDIELENIHPEILIESK